MLLVYGSYGYTGELVVEEALRHGLRPILAGRNAERVQQQAAKAGLEARPFALDDSNAVDQGLEGISVVLHCAGPFSRTAKQMAEGCMRKGAHYLDVTGEIVVFELMVALGEKAKQANVMLLPGVGFDVVPSDCLAAYLKSKLPSATHLTLSFYGKGRTSHGTATTIVENLHRGGAIRKDGTITHVPAAYKTATIDYGPEQRHAMTIPWGDVSTAYHSTGIPNIEVFMGVPKSVAANARRSRWIAPLLGWGPVQRFMKSKIPAGGPSPEERAQGYSLLWGKASDDAGNSVEARMRTPEGYTITAMAAVLIARKVLDGHAPIGFQTPSTAYGMDVVMELEGVTREG